MADFLSACAFVGIYGLSYGTVLFLISVGLVVTMGLVRVVNMAHGVFAAVGGYVVVHLMNQAQVPFVLALLISVLVVALGSVIIERVFFGRIYKASELEQALLTIGLAFIGIASLNVAFGVDVVALKLPHVLARNVEFAGRSVQVYRLFVIGVGLAIMLALWLLFDRTAFGARLRAAVDNRSMAESVGINVRRLFSLSYALGSGLAALGGAVGAAILPLEPMYPLKYLVLILMIVVMSGKGHMKLAAGVSIGLGVIDTAGRYVYPEVGSFLIYIVLLAYLVARGNSLLFAPVAR